MMKIKHKTLAEIIVSMNSYIDTKPEFRKTSSGDVHVHDMRNPDYDRDVGGYDDLVEIFACERYIRFKLRDPVLMVEHDISFLPWCDEFSYNIWYDDPKYRAKIDRSSNQAFRSSYVRSEEEYFQASTLKDFKGVEFETFLEVDKLQVKLYNYFSIIPCGILEK